MGKIHHKISEIIEEKKDILIDASNYIWDLAEMKFEEFESVDHLCELLKAEGFQVERDVGGIETAFIATYGDGSPVIGILGEYDALSGMSQQAGVPTKTPIKEGDNGHGCGHNLLGVGSLGAVLAVKQMIDERQLSGTIRYYGCPAEEGGSGKTYMVRAGLFDDVDIALTWHPGTSNSIMCGQSLANYQVYYKFKGKSSHAAISPHLGRSALDAVELMNVGVNYLREHIIPEARVHYAVTHTGGHSPNVVQAEAEVLYLMRAPQVDDVEHIYKRINDIAKGAALMTGTEVDIVFDKACSNTIINHTLNELLHEHFEKTGVPSHTDAEKEFAQQIGQTLGKQNVDTFLADNLEPYKRVKKVMSASTDVGDVSWVAPTAQCEVACFAVGTPYHSWQLVSQGKTSLAHKGMLYASKIIAATATELLMNPEKIHVITDEWQQQLGGKTYKSPIPPEVHPPRPLN